MNIKFKNYWRKTSLKKSQDGKFLLNHIYLIKPKMWIKELFKGLNDEKIS